MNNKSNDEFINLLKNIGITGNVSFSKKEEKEELKIRLLKEDREHYFEIFFKYFVVVILFLILSGSSIMIFISQNETSIRFLQGVITTIIGALLGSLIKK